MINTIDDNRTFLRYLVFSAPNFTVEQIVSEYTKNRGDAIIDGLESIPGFIEGLEEDGSLEWSNGQYHVVKTARLPFRQVIL